MHIETMNHGSNKSFKILASKKKVDNFFLEENHWFFCFFSMFCKTWLWDMVKHATHFGKRFMNTMHNKNSLVCKFFFVANFCHLVTKKKGSTNPTKGFLRIKKKKSPYLEIKKF